MLGEADSGVVVDGLRRREQDDAAGGGFQDFHQEEPADALALVGGPDAEVGAISDEGKVGEAAGGAEEGVAVPGRGEEVGMLEHLADGLPVVYGAAFPEGGGVEQVDVLIDGQGGVDSKEHLAIR